MKIFSLSRRSFITGLFCAGFAAISLPEKPLWAQEQSSKKPLVVYFSHTGNTKKLAEKIHNLVGGDILRIEPEQPYSDNYDECLARAKDEQKNNARPAVKTRIANPADYGVIFLGFPNWCSGMPMAVHTFIDQNRLDGKTIAPFITHGGGGEGHGVAELKKSLPQAKVLKSLSVKGTEVDRIEGNIKKWLEGLGPALIMTTTGNPAIYPDGAY